MKASNAISSRKAPGNQPGTADSSSSTAERFSLTGPSILLDPKIHAFRDDLADVALAAHLFAPHYARPVTRRCGPAPAGLHIAASEQSELLATLAPDEEFALLDITGAWGWGYRRRDHLVGYIRADLLAEEA